MQFKRVKVAAVTAAISLGLVVITSTAFAGAASAANSGKKPLAGVKLTIGSKDFTESIVLSKLIKQLVLANGGKVVDKTNIKGSVTTREALTKGSIDAYWEYTGTAWLVYQKQTSTNLSPTDLYAKVAAGDKANNVTWLPMTTFNDTYAFAMTKDKAAKYGVANVSDVSKVPASDAVWCVESEFQSRPDGWAGFQKAYGLSIPASQLKVIDTGAIYKATQDGQCTFGEVFATDGRIGALKLKVISDDKNYFPAYNAGITLRNDTAKKYPQLVKLLAPLASKISNEAMQTLNARVDVLGENADDVAKSFLVSKGLIK